MTLRNNIKVLFLIYLGPPTPSWPSKSGLLCTEFPLYKSGFKRPKHYRNSSQLISIDSIKLRQGLWHYGSTQGPYSWTFYFWFDKNEGLDFFWSINISSICKHCLNILGIKNQQKYFFRESIVNFTKIQALKGLE